ncbi:unnamed protein product [Ilex paraguariensis]|uniref:Uncharacterized protein n=1 Tax=Ilex paraguariensis TaxID=185542 RepID=A0ABC8R4E7_9AQUA
MAVFQSDLRSATHIATPLSHLLNPARSDFTPDTRLSVRTPRASLIALIAGKKNANKPSICTADELHYVSVHNSDWRLALWRYKGSPKAPLRNHPLLLLSGVGTNATGYDLAPG